MSEPNQARVERDADGLRTQFEDIEVGADLGTLEWRVTREDIEKQCHIDEDWSEWFIVDSPYDGIIAPPQIQYRPPRWLLSRRYNIRGVFYRWEFENVRPIRPDRTIRLNGRVKGKWIAKEREFVEFEFEAHDETDELLFVTRRVHVLDVTKRSVPRAGEGVDSGKKPEKI